MDVIHGVSIGKDQSTKVDTTQCNYCPIMFNKIRIAAFEARIDKSKALQWSYSTKLKRAEDEGEVKSPYFCNSTAEQKPLVCSLLEHEANSYRYRLPALNLQPKLERGERFLDERKQQVLLSQLRPTVPFKKEYVGLNSVPISKRDHHLLDLKEILNKSVLKTNRLAVTNSYKRYPRLPTSLVLSKYSHLFGLKPKLLASSSNRLSHMQSKPRLKLVVRSPPLTPVEIREIDRLVEES